MKTICKSRNRCPFCGGKEWILRGGWYHDEVLKIEPASEGKIALIDNDDSWNDLQSGQLVDECAKCGAVIS